MRIALDVRKFADFGIGTYIRNLFGFLVRQPGIHLSVIAAYDQEKYFAALPAVKVLIDRSPKYSISELVTIARKVNPLGCHVFHAPHYTLPYGLRVPSVVTVHDLIHLRFPQHFSLLQRAYARVIIGHACKAARAVIVDAEFTKREILATFRISPDRVHVIPLGVAPEFRPAATEDEARRDAASLGIPGPYILYVGGLKPHKNLPTLLEAFARLRHRNSVRLVVSGEDFWSNTTLARLAGERGITDRILSLPAEGERLVKLYRGATVVVVPSLYEGFGLPVVEAMACGTPVIAARATSLPEVMGEGGMMFDPSSPGELSSFLERVLEDEVLRKSQREYGLANAARFSWDECGKKTLNIYRTVAGGT